jgi:hypothetical protein
MLDRHPKPCFYHLKLILFIVEIFVQIPAGSRDENYFKKTCRWQSGELCPSLPNLASPLPKIDIDNKSCFRHLDDL